MDILDSEGSSASSSDEERVNEGPVGANLGVAAADARVARVRDFTGQCVGDDARVVGTMHTRIVALQSGGTGVNRQHWGHFWASGVKELGGDIGVISESRIYTEKAHAAACRGVSAAGYVAISHGVGRSGGEHQAHLANGVVLLVRETYAGLELPPY